jgi:hypothetical protein
MLRFGYTRETLAMRDELQLLKDNKNLSRLLSHYASAGAADRETWQDRVMEMEGADRQALVKLHGILLAYSWIEQNTGSVSLLQPGVVRQCYRISAAGLKALKTAAVKNDAEAEVEAAA